jgi:hypothetical protein
MSGEVAMWLITAASPLSIPAISTRTCWMSLRSRMLKPLSRNELIPLTSGNWAENCVDEEAESAN